MNNENTKSFKFSVNSWLTVEVWAHDKAEALKKAYKFGIADLKALK